MRHPSIMARRRRFWPAIGGAIAVVFLLANITAQPAVAQIFNPTTFTLDNGLEVVVIENHRAPVVTHMVWNKVGAADEPPGKSGIAHFLEHLMFKGTAKRGPGEFSEIIARNGGSENAFTSQDYTGYFQSITADRLALMMELEADRMNGLVLTEEIIQPERQVVIEERRSRTDNSPRARLSEQVTAATYTNHPYRLPIIGWEHEIRALTLQEIVDFYRTWYAPNNAVLVVSGDVTPEQVRELAETHYGPIPAKALSPRIRPSEPPHHAPREVVLRDARVDQPGCHAADWTQETPCRPNDGRLARGSTSVLDPRCKTVRLPPCCLARSTSLQQPPPPRASIIGDDAGGGSAGMSATAALQGLPRTVSFLER